jgi:hypothetical protein
VVVFCVETEQSKDVETFSKETHKRLTTNSMATMMFKNDSFAYIIKEKQRFVILVNIETNIIAVPRFFCYYVMKYAIRKKGYKGKIKRIKNNTILLKFAKVFKNLSRRNNPMAK